MIDSEFIKGILEKRKKPNTEKIYFLKCGPFVKIGITSDIPSRLSTLRSGNPVEIQLLFAITGDSRKEAELHIRFAEYRRRGEWFLFMGGLKSFIEECLSAPSEWRLDTRRWKMVGPKPKYQYPPVFDSADYFANRNPDFYGDDNDRVCITTE